MLLLILAHGHLVGAVYEDVGSHQNGVGEKPCVDVVGLSAHLLLEGAYALKFTYIHIHREQQTQLANLRQVALYIKGGLFGVETRCQVVNQHVLHIRAQVGRLGMCGEGVIVGNEKIAVVFLLHFDEIP